MYESLKFVNRSIRLGLHVLRRLQSTKNTDSQESDDAAVLDTVKRGYSLVTPCHVSAARGVPHHICKPDYVQDNKLMRTVRERILNRRRLPHIEIKSDFQIQGMREACRLAREVLNIAGQKVSPGITTDQLDALVHNECIAREAYPSPLQYRGFPKSVCTSVNNVACHGIPDDRPLCDGDIVNIDVTIFYKGFHGDVSETFPVGNVIESGLRLLHVARQCRDVGIDVCGPGRQFNLIGKTIRRTADEAKCKVIPVFCGHGIGSFFHGPPDIIHIDNDVNLLMKEGMTFTVEPVITDGSPDIDILSDGWTAVTKDGSRSAQFEHTVLITRHGVDILTL